MNGVMCIYLRLESLSVGRLLILLYVRSVIKYISGYSPHVLTAIFITVTCPCLSSLFFSFRHKNTSKEKAETESRDSSEKVKVFSLCGWWQSNNTRVWEGQGRSCTGEYLLMRGSGFLGAASLCTTCSDLSCCERFFRNRVVPLNS